jgi:hypothetical protein
MYTLTKTFRTKSDAKQAVKNGEVLHIVRHDGQILNTANGFAFPVSGKLDHYKEWTGTAKVTRGKVEVIR